MLGGYWTGAKPILQAAGYEFPDTSNKVNKEAASEITITDEPELMEEAHFADDIDSEQSETVQFIAESLCVYVSVCLSVWVGDRLCSTSIYTV